MFEHKHLTKAPIREAVIDIQITPNVSLDILKTIAAHLSHKPHKQDDLWQSTIDVHLNEDGQGSARNDRNPVGHRYTFKNSPYVLLCQVRGFTFSHLAPYTNWEEVSAIAKEFWEIYSEVTKPQTISRIAVRYINSIPIPLPVVDFADYLHVPPVIPEGLPQSLSSFLQRFVVVDSSTETIAVVTQVLEDQQPQSSKVSLLFDIDVFRTYSEMLPNTNDIWAVLNELRNFKNLIFFKYLTEKTIRMFE